MLGSMWFELKALVDARQPAIAAKLAEFRVTEPMKDPAGIYWIQNLVIPFHKRSNSRTV